MLLRFVCFLAACSACFSQCTQNTLRGTWALYTQGVIMMTPPGSTQAAPALGAQLLTIKVDYQGRFTGSGFMSLNGQTASGSLGGVFQVNPDCTATDTFWINSITGMPPFPGQGFERLVILNNGTEMRGQVTQGVLGAPVGVDYYRRISWGDAQCTSDMVRGLYAFSYEGAVVMTPPGETQPQAVPTSIVGTSWVDYQNRMTGGMTNSMGGAMMDFNFVNSSGSVNADCTGISTWSIVPKGTTQALPGQGIDHTVVLNGGDEIISITTQGVMGGPVLIGKMKRISLTPTGTSW